VPQGTFRAGRVHLALLWFRHVWNAPANAVKTYASLNGTRSARRFLYG
jgi:hypothetical protein